MLLDQKCKICRRAGEKLFLKGERCFSQKCAMIRSPATPGVQGTKKKRRSAVSEFGMQLREKQKVRFNYRVSEAQFKKYIEEVFKKGATGEAVISKLERRLDNTVYRLGFADSRSIARQLVGHGHFYVNNRKIDIPSYEVRVGDIIQIRPAAQKFLVFQNLKEKLKKYTFPSWLDLDKDSLKGEVKSMPGKEDLATPFNMNLIIEYYSR